MRNYAKIEELEAKQVSTWKARMEAIRTSSVAQFSGDAQAAEIAADNLDEAVDASDEATHALAVERLKL